MKQYNNNIFERYLSFPIYRLFNDNSFIFHNTYEYNIWVDLIKTSTFDEFNFGNNNIILCLILYIFNIIFYIASFVGVIITIVKVVDSIINKKIRHTDSLLNFRIICLMLFALAIFAYLYFNIKYPYSCNSNYRYIAYITFAMAGCISTAIFL